jgi:prepilin-type N-terminal cleavage/methylation domain-containing protein
MSKRIHRQEGFTLIELMIVILIIGILVGIAVPVFLAARGNAQAKSCQSNQKNFETSADIFAGETGDYPDALTIAAGYDGSTGISTGAWPVDYYQGNFNAANTLPACTVGTGAISVVQGLDVDADTTIRPAVTCSIVEHRRPGAPGT